MTDADLGTARGRASSSPAPTRARAIAAHPRRGELLALPVLAVGRSSAEAARDAGFTRCRRRPTATPTIWRGSAARTLRRSRAPLLLSRRRGSRRRPGGAWPDGSPSTPSWSIAPPRRRAFRPSAHAALEQRRIDGVLHFSRRSVEAYRRLRPRRPDRGGARPAHFCLSGAGRRAAAAGGAARDRSGGAAGRGRLLALVTSKVMPKPRVRICLEWPAWSNENDRASDRRRRAGAPTVIDLPATEIPSRSRRGSVAAGSCRQRRRTNRRSAASRPDEPEPPPRPRRRSRSCRGSSSVDPRRRRDGRRGRRAGRGAAALVRRRVLARSAMPSPRPQSAARRRWRSS